jgi:hypothetical protein
VRGERALLLLLLRAPAANLRFTSGSPAQQRARLFRALLRQTGSVRPAASVVVPAELPTVQLPRNVIVRRVPSPIRSAPIMMSIIAVAVRNAAPPLVGVETPAAAAGHLDNICFIGRARQNRRGTRRRRRSGQAENTNQNRSCHTHLGFPSLSGVSPPYTNDAHRREFHSRESLSGARVLVLARFFVDAHQAAQLVASARQARAHRADRHLEDRRDLVIGHAFEADEQDHLALLRR